MSYITTPTADGTYNAVTLEPVTHTDGYYVSRPFGVRVFTEDTAGIAAAVESLRADAIAYGDYVGVWTDDTDTAPGWAVTYVDRTVHVQESRYNAANVGWAHTQLAIWDIRAGAAVAVSQPLTDAVDGVTLYARIDGATRGHAWLCETHRARQAGITRKPVQASMIRHLADAHGIAMDTWTPEGSMTDAYRESDTGHVLTVARDTAGTPNSFGFTWTRSSAQGLVDSGTAGNATAARALARMSY